MADLWQRYYREHSKPKKKARTAREDLRKWEMDIEPALGRLKVAAVERTDISALHASLHHKPVQANRILALVSHMFTMAERWGFRPEGANPCRHVRHYREGKRERYLSSAEVVRLGEILAEVEKANREPPEAIAAIRLLILTGCRKSEILDLQWKNVDFEHRVLILPDSKTGARGHPLGAPALTLLRILSSWRTKRNSRPPQKLGAIWCQLVHNGEVPAEATQNAKEALQCLGGTGRLRRTRGVGERA